MNLRSQAEEEGANGGGLIGEALELLRNFAVRQHMPSGEIF